MKILKLKIIVLLFLQIKCQQIEIQFLVDFFEPRNVTIVANICWSFDSIKQLSTKFFSSDIPKKIVYNRSFNVTNFLNNPFNNFFIVDLSCEEAPNFLQQANGYGLFKAPHNWLIVESNISKSENKLIDILGGLKILIDSEIYGTIKNGDLINIYQYYKINKNANLIREEFGEWTSEKGLKITIESNITSYRRKDFAKEIVRLTIVVLHNDTLNHLEDYRDPVMDMITKASFGIVLNLIQYINASYTLLSTLYWGYKTKTGDMIGMVGHLKADEADISVSGMVFIDERAEFVDYIKMIVPTGIYFYFRKPPLSYTQNIFTLPFRWTLWVSMIILVIIVGMLLYISVMWENKHKKPGERHFVFGDIAIISLSAMCLQGVHVEPKSFAARTLTFFLFTALMFLYTAYSANIVALLQSTTNDITTLEDLLHSRIKCGADDIVYNRYFLENAKEQVRKAIYQEKIGPSGFYNKSEGLMRLKKGLFAFLVEKGPGYYHMLKLLDESEKCELQEIGGYIEASDTWIAIQQKSPYKEIFKVGLYKIDEYGLQKRVLNRFYKKPQCSQSASSFTSVGIVDFYPALVVYIIGLILALIVFGLEKMIKKYSITLQKNKRKIITKAKLEKSTLK